jgi:hypothetical protein
MPAQAGIQLIAMDSGIHRNDDRELNFRAVNTKTMRTLGRPIQAAHHFVQNRDEVLLRCVLAAIGDQCGDAGDSPVCREMVGLE